MNDHAVSIRRAVPDDAPALAEIHVLAWQAGYRGLLPDSFLDSLSAAERLPRWRERLASKSETVFVAELNGQVAGWLVIGPQRDQDLDPQRSAEIYAVYVYPDFWRRGCGAALLAQAKDEMRLQGYAEASLWVLRGNQRAIRFYEAHGFQPDGASKIETNRAGIAFDEVRYRCALTPPPLGPIFAKPPGRSLKECNDWRVGLTVPACLTDHSGPLASELP